MKEFPPLSLTEMEALRESILAHGLKYNIKILPDGRIIDGYHRWKVLGDRTPYDIIDVEEETAIGIARILNTARRQLSAEQVKVIYDRIKPQALKFRKLGHTQPETAGHFGVSQQVVSKWEGTTASEFRTNTTRGISSKRRRGTPKLKIPRGEYEVIYDRWKGGESQEQVAADYKVTQKAISGIVTKVMAKLEKETKARAVKPPEGVTLLPGDFREVESQIPDAFVDLIFTDPPYGEEYLGLWGDLSRVAARVLKPGGYLVAYAPHPFLPTVLKSLGDHLNYYWICGVRHTGGEARIWEKSIFVRWKPMVIFSSGEGGKHEWLNDLIEGREGDKDLHGWAQGEGEAAYFIEKLTPPGGVVLDPMMGSGTTLKAALKLKRQAIGIEKDPETYKKVCLDG